ncbi:MAG: mevalonate kinase [Thaumarchaeota archaeon]|jgi:mevalonate kinase|nr:MAG: mevalonate kinase [Nitrososphaerota archaeon]
MNNSKHEAISSAPAKVILFGEHFVVYHNPAIVAAINKRIHVHAEVNNMSSISIKSGQKSLNIPTASNDNFIQVYDKTTTFLYPIFKCVKHVLSEKEKQTIGINLHINSEIPYGEGLGSSAASCVATIAALYSLFSNRDKHQIYNTAKIMEQNIHTNSSGVDCYVSTFGGIVDFEPNKGFSKIETAKKFSVLIGTTGVKHSTGEVVSQVKLFREKNLSHFKELSSKASMICTKARKAMDEGNELELGSLFTENQKLLSMLGVSHPLIEKLIERCINNGALGAKLTGAGRGGAIIALLPTDKNKEIADRISRESGKWMLVEFDHDGVAIG